MTDKHEENEMLSVELLRRVADVLRMLAHPLRLRIIENLRYRSEVPVHEISEALHIPQATASQHLNLMRRAGIIKSRRQGKEVFYSIADERCVGILECMRGKEANG